MKVIVNASGYAGQSGGAGGAGVLLQYLIAHLADICDVDVLVRPNSKNFCGQQRKARFIELPYLMADTLRHLRVGPTVVLDPFGGLPCGPFPDDLALCVVVHDLMHLERPHFFTAAERQGRSVGFAAGLQRADAIITPSEDQARAIRHFFPGASPIVIPHLPFLTLEVSGDDRTLAEGLGRFVLFPGVKWPHKNHKTVIEAFTAYIRRTRSDLRLVMCGGPCAESRFSFFPSTKAVSDQVVDLGLVSNGMLRALFAQADAVLFPTLYEGFGIPVLEAAYQGKMIAASGLAVFDEILGASTYRRVTDPLCHIRWMEVFADIEGPARAKYEREAEGVRQRVDVAGYIARYAEVLKSSAERYTHPAFYPVRNFPSGDRLTSSLLIGLGFADLYGTAAVDRGARHAALGPRPMTQSSWIYRSAGAPPDRKQCLRAQFEVQVHQGDVAGSLQFSAWVRLLNEADLDELHWSANDQGVSNVLPTLRDGEWHLIRAAVPDSGFIDFRGLRRGESEVAGFDIEIHDPSIFRVANLIPPAEQTQPHHLTVLVAALADQVSLNDVIASVTALNAALSSSAFSVRWSIISRVSALGGDIAAADLPSNLRFHIVTCDPISRADATAFVSPYEPIRKLLLLEAGDLPACLKKSNLQVLAAALSTTFRSGECRLELEFNPGAYWLEGERGRVMDVGHRIGQPIPLLDPGVMAAVLNTEQPKTRPRFAVIETDQISSISHHETVSALFLSGAKTLGFQPVLGINRLSVSGRESDIETFALFSPQVYSIGTADGFTDELAQFVGAAGLGPEDFVFMHSLSPQIVLGTARFIAENPLSSPNFAMRFFSTAEAMAGHKLSYVKILGSIERVRVVRRKMQFFCESENLIEYYRHNVGRSYPLLFNPEHPSLAVVRESEWFDPALGGGQVPTLAYLGEAREEKGFDDLPGIIHSLIESESMADFQFLIQTGSNSGNDTANVAHAKTAIFALKAKYPGRIRTFESVETPEQFYFLMKHAQGLIAPYKSSAYGKRGTGVTLEALQMGLTVFAWADTDLNATFRDTGRVVAVREGSSFAGAIIEYYESKVTTPPDRSSLSINLSPAAVIDRLLSHVETNPGAVTEPVLWVGNDTFGEGCSTVYAAQKRALHELDRDCFELFVPWPDPNWAGVDRSDYDTIIYGLNSEYDSKGLAWVAIPTYTSELYESLRDIERSGPTYGRLRALNTNFSVPLTLKRAISRNRVRQVILNYAHLYPIIEGLVPIEQIICEMHDIIAYQHAVRRGNEVLLTEKIDEFSDLSHFSKIIAISAEEHRETAAACPASTVYWKMPPYIPEPPPSAEAASSGPTAVEELRSLGGIPKDVIQPSLLMLRAYYTRPDLQAIFRLDTEGGRMAFFRWWFFFGQFEIPSGFGLTPRQLEWATARWDNEKSATVNGMLTLILSVRDDLRKTFGTISGINIEALNAWERENAEREFGFSMEYLMERGKAAYSGVEIDHPHGMSPALSAVLEAGPITRPDSSHHMTALCERLLDVEQVDLLLIGSGHPANVASFRWFISEIFLEYFAGRGRNLFIVGTVCDALQEVTHYGIFRLGRCMRLGPMLEASRACPIPVIVGSGSPIKTVPALALNGAVTVTDHIERAFGLANYGIPAFSKPREFADDLWALLSDNAHRSDRCSRASRYVEENLTLDGYIKFWTSLLVE